MRKLMALVIGLAMLTVAACETVNIPAPETTREKLVAAELSFDFVLDEVNNLVALRVITPGSETAYAIGQTLVEIDKGLEIWRANPDNIAYSLIVLTLLDDLKLYLLELARDDKLGDVSWRLAA